MNRKNTLTALGIGAACVACCAPLILPLFIGAGAVVGAGGGLLAGLSRDSIICGAIGVGLLGLLAFWLVQRQRRATAAGCGCSGSCTANCSGTTASAQ